MIKKLNLIIICLFLTQCFGEQDFLTIPSNLEASSSINVTSENSVVHSIELSPAIQQFVLVVGQSYPLHLNVRTETILYRHVTDKLPYDQNRSVVWFSNDSQVASISSKGLIQAHQPGETLILASLDNKTIQFRLQVIDNEYLFTTLAFASDSVHYTDGLNNKVGFDFQLIDSFGYQYDYTNLIWASAESLLDCVPSFSLSDPAIAVYNDGYIRSLKNGETILSFTCGDFSDDLTITVSGFSDRNPTNDEDEDFSYTVSEIHLSSATQEFLKGSSTTFSADLVFAEGPNVNNVTSLFTLDGQTGELVWESSDETVFTVHQGHVEFISYGQATLSVSFQDLKVDLVLFVKEATETPSDGNFFLGADDGFTTYFGADSGFGLDDFPDVILGPPAGSLDTLSFGTGGSMIIELEGYQMVDGLGADFTIFENPFAGWQECADVAVSADGLNYHSFNCQRIDPDLVFPHCAGVNDVVVGLNREDYLNPNLSGGDSFDLHDLRIDLPYVTHIKITHLDYCVAAAGDEPTFGAGNAGGFDLDALVILNGSND